MNYRLELSASAKRYLVRAPRPTQLRISHRLEQLCEDPMAALISKALKGPGRIRSSRLGDLRILYTVDEQIYLLSVSRIGPRGDVYRG